MSNILRDPIWQGIGAILAFLSLVTYLIVERDKIFFRRSKKLDSRKELEVSLPSLSIPVINRPLLGKWIASNIIGWGYAFVVAIITAYYSGVNLGSTDSGDDTFGIFLATLFGCLTQSFTQWRFLRKHRESVTWWIIITPIAFFIVVAVFAQFINVWTLIIVWTIFSWLWGYSLIHDREPIS